MAGLIGTATAERNGLMSIRQARLLALFELPWTNKTTYTRLFQLTTTKYNDGVYMLIGHTNSKTSDVAFITIRNNNSVLFSRLSGRLHLYKDENHNIYVNNIIYSSVKIRVLYENGINVINPVNVDIDVTELTEITSVLQD